MSLEGKWSPPRPRRFVFRIRRRVTGGRPKQRRDCARLPARRSAPAEGDRPSEGGTGQAADGARHLKKATAYFARASRRDPPRSRAIARSGRVRRNAECARSAPAAIANSARGRGEERVHRSPAGSAPWPKAIFQGRFQCDEGRLWLATYLARIPVAPNRLERRLTVAAPKRVWAADIAAVWTAAGWLTLAIVVDLFSRHGRFRDARADDPATGDRRIADGQVPSTALERPDLSQIAAVRSGE